MKHLVLPICVFLSLSANAENMQFDEDADPNVVTIESGNVWINGEAEPMKGMTLGINDECEVVNFITKVMPECGDTVKIGQFCKYIPRVKYQVKKVIDSELGIAIVGNAVNDKLVRIDMLNISTGLTDKQVLSHPLLLKKEKPYTYKVLKGKIKHTIPCYENINSVIGSNVTFTPDSVMECPKKTYTGYVLCDALKCSWKNHLNKKESEEVKTYIKHLQSVKKKIGNK